MIDGSNSLGEKIGLENEEFQNWDPKTDLIKK